MTDTFMWNWKCLGSQSIGAETNFTDHFGTSFLYYWFLFIGGVAFTLANPGDQNLVLFTDLYMYMYPTTDLYMCVFVFNNQNN